MMRISRPSRAALVLLSAGLVLTTCLVGVWLWLELQRTIATRTRTRSALLVWQQIVSRLKDAETGARGYIITDEDTYLEPFKLADDELPRLLMEATIAEAALEDGLTADRFDAIQKRLNDFMSATQETITVAQREGGERAAELLKEGKVKHRMDGMRRVLDERLGALDNRLRGLDADMKTNLTMGGRALMALVTAALAATGLSAGLLRQALLQARRNERLALEKQQSDRANREKSVFLATMSHEIRTPMNAILGFGELLWSDARDDKQKRYASSIVRSGQALLQLINDILDFSKLEAGMTEIAHDPVDVRELADFTRQLFTHQCEEKGVTLEVEVEDWVPRSLRLDGARLRQIVINLVGNAVKFTPAGTVWLRFRGGPLVESAGHCQLVVEVSDTGIGVPAGRLEQIFDPFVQAKANQDAEMKGTGLGLAIVKRLTLLMGGSISVRSEEGRGSTFTVELPEVEISARLAPSADPSTEAAVDFNQLQPSRLLVVDDNPENLLVVQGFFDGSHHTVATASNGKEALDWLGRNARPDAVLMDIRMPVMDGRTALRELRARGDCRLLPVIAVTASIVSSEERELRESFNGYIRKPFSRAQLLAELAHFIPSCAQDGPGATTGGHGPVPATWGPLAEQLRAIEQTTWPSVRDGMVMSGISEFATQLRRLGQDADCPPLQSLAGRLLQAAETFSLDDLEKLLAEFPGIITSIEERARTPSP